MANLIKGKQAIIAATDSTIDATNKVMDTWQNIALSAVQHAIDHSDKSVAEYVANNITKSNGVSASKMRQYMEFAFNATLDDGALNFLPRRGKDGQELKSKHGYKDISFEKAKAVKWYNFKAEQGDNSKDLAELLESFKKAAKKSVKAGKVTQAQVDAVTAEYEAQILDAEETKAA